MKWDFNKVVLIVEWS